MKKQKTENKKQKDMEKKSWSLWSRIFNTKTIPICEPQKQTFASNVYIN